MENYKDFLEGVLLSRTVRDADCSCSPGHPVELWLDIELETIEDDKEWTSEEKQELALTAKFAELLDDRKKWLLEEITRDLYLIDHPGQWSADATVPVDGGWEAHGRICAALGKDDSGCSYDGYIEPGSLTFTGNIKAETLEEAGAILRERVRIACSEEIPVAA
jgi:hypothetical protein